MSFDELHHLRQNYKNKCRFVKKKKKKNALISFFFLLILGNLLEKYLEVDPSVMAGNKRGLLSILVAS